VPKIGRSLIGTVVGFTSEIRNKAAQLSNFTYLLAPPTQVQVRRIIKPTMERSFDRHIATGRVKWQTIISNTAIDCASSTHTEESGLAATSVLAGNQRYPVPWIMSEHMQAYQVKNLLRNGQ